MSSADSGALLSALDWALDTLGADSKQLVLYLLRERYGIRLEARETSTLELIENALRQLLGGDAADLVLQRLQEHLYRIHPEVVANLQELEDFCRELIKLDPSIVFVAVANHIGHPVTTVYKEGIIPALSVEQTDTVAINTINPMTKRNPLLLYIGKLRCSISMYDKFILATIPLVSDKSHKYFILISFSLGSDYCHIVEKILSDIAAKKKK